MRPDFHVIASFKVKGLRDGLELRVRMCAGWQASLDDEHAPRDAHMLSVEEACDATPRCPSSALQQVPGKQDSLVTARMPAGSEHHAHQQ